MAANLYDYYTGSGQALPSVSQRSQLYSQYGLGGGYTGSSVQNAALLGKLQGGYAVTPTGSVSGSSGGGYSSVPTGQPQPVSNDPGYGDLTSFAATNKAERQALVDRLSGESAGAYDTYAGQAGLPGANDALKRIQDDLAATGVKIADTPLAVNEGVRGTFASDQQRQTEIGSDLAPLQALYSKVAAALPGASTAQQNALQSVQTKIGLLAQRQQLALSGFDESSQNELAAIQAKVARGQQLTDMEFQRETQLSAAKIAAQAQAASAAATVKAAEIGANQSGINAALAYPGVTAAKQPNGTYSASLPSYLTGSNPSSSQAISDYISKYLPAVTGK